MPENGVSNAADQPVWPVRTDFPAPLWYPPLPPVKVAVRPDLLPAGIVLVVVALLGIGIGWVWSVLAPPQRMRVLGDQQQAPLPVESYHRFDDLVIFVLLALGAGLVTGIGVWLLRSRRGPVLLVAAVLGGVAAGGLAVWLGLAWAQARYALPAPPALGAVVEKAPTLESMWILVAWPLTTALAYGALAAWNGTNELDRGPL